MRRIGPMPGVWADRLTTEEAEGTLVAARALETVPWAGPVLAAAGPVLNKLRTGFSDLPTYQLDPVRPDERGLLFEIRVARSLARLGLSARYEAPTIDATSIDFGIDMRPPVLLEVVGLRESNAVQEATWSQDHFAGLLLGGDRGDPRQTEAGELLAAQGRIAAKAYRDGRPIKFPSPLPGGALNAVLVDARGFLGLGIGDDWDWRQLMLGPAGVPAPYVHVWSNPQSGESAPIRGLFESNCPIRAASTFRERVHAVGFVSEETFEPDEIAARTFWILNPGLVRGHRYAFHGRSLLPLLRRKSLLGVAP